MPGASTRRSVACCPYPRGPENRFPLGNRKGGNQPHGNSLDYPDCRARPRAARVLFAQRLVAAPLGPRHAFYGPPRPSGAAPRALQRSDGRDAPAAGRGRRRARAAAPRRDGSPEWGRDRQRALLGVRRYRRLVARRTHAEPARVSASSAVCPRTHTPRGIALADLSARGRGAASRAVVDSRGRAVADRARARVGAMVDDLRNRALTRPPLHDPARTGTSPARSRAPCDRGGRGAPTDGHVGRRGEADALLATLRHELRGARTARSPSSPTGRCRLHRRSGHRLSYSSSRSR